MTIARTTPTAIAHRHGYTQPAVCQDCGTTELLHFGSWHDPATATTGDFYQCCACGLASGDLPADHANCTPAV